MATLKKIKAIASRYNSKLKKPIKLSQKKASLVADLKARKVSLLAPQARLKIMVKKANRKKLNFEISKAVAENKKELGPQRHLDSVIDRLEKKYGKKHKKKHSKQAGFGMGMGMGAGMGAGVQPKVNIVIPRKKQPKK